jgi:murein DD-endopeptidase MepM/ murein hydrolase activator NlpD
MRWMMRFILVAIAATAYALGRIRPEPVASIPRLEAPNDAAETRRVLAGQPGGIIVPVAGVQRAALKDSFNDGRVGHIHHAIDILAPRGTPVVAAVDGRIQKLFTSAAGGLTIYQFDRAGELVYYYAHLDSYAPSLTEGMAVAQGSVIGYVGTTGNAPANTPHLHFAIERMGPERVWWRAEAINPYPILTTGASSPPAHLSALR